MRHNLLISVQIYKYFHTIRNESIVFRYVASTPEQIFVFISSLRNPV